MAEKKEVTKIFCIRLPEELRVKLKTEAVSKGTYMKKIMIDILEERYSNYSSRLNYKPPENNNTNKEKKDEN